MALSAILHALHCYLVAMKLSIKFYALFANQDKSNTKYTVQRIDYLQIENPHKHTKKGTQSKITYM